MSGRNVRVTPVRPANIGRLQSLIVKNSRYKTPAAKTQEITKMIRGVDSISDPEGKDRFLKEFQDEHGYPDAPPSEVEVAEAPLVADIPVVAEAPAEVPLEADSYPVKIRKTLEQGDCFYSAIYRSAKERQGLLERLSSCVGIQHTNEAEFVQGFRNIIADQIVSGRLPSEEEGVDTFDYLSGLFISNSNSYAELISSYPKWFKEEFSMGLGERETFIQLLASHSREPGEWVGEIEVRIVKVLLEPCDISIEVRSNIQNNLYKRSQGKDVLHLYNRSECHYEYFSFVADPVKVSMPVAPQVLISKVPPASVPVPSAPVPQVPALQIPLPEPPPAHPQKVFYDPRNGDQLSSHMDAIKQLEKILREIKTSQNNIPVSLYGLNNATTSYDFLLNVFCNPEISLDDMVSFALDKGGNPGSDIYEVLCRLYVFFGGVDGVNPRQGGNYKFMKKIEEAGERFDTAIDALKSIKCKATSVSGVSDITIVNTGGRLVKEIKSTDPYCEVECDMKISEQIQTYLMSVKWYKKEKSAEHYDLEKLFVAANKITTVEQHPIAILVFLKSKEDFRIAHNRAYRQYVKGLAENFLGWKEDVKPFLQNIRREIFEGAQQSGLSPQDLVIRQYLGATSKPTLNLYLHQDIIVEGTVDSFAYSSDNKYVIGVLPRGGKTNIAGGIMREYLKRKPDKPLHVFWITAAPTETRSQVSNDLLTKYQDFDDFDFNDAVNIEDITQSKKKNAVWFISNNLLTQHKLGRSKARDFLSALISGQTSMGLVFFDEAHAGGSGEQTSKAVEDIIENYKENNLPLIFLTATYYSIVLDYKIIKDNIFIWDYTDVLKTRALGTESEREEAIVNLKRRFGPTLVQDVLDRRIANNDTYEGMSKPYLDYPDLLFISADFQEEAKERFERQNVYRPLQGFDIGSIFALRQNIEEEKAIDPHTGKPKGSSWRSRYVFTGDRLAPVRVDAWRAFDNLENPRNIIALLTPPNPEQTFEEDAPGGRPLTQSEEDATRGIEPSILGRINKLSKSNDSRFRLEENPTIMMFMPVGGAGSSIEHLLPAWAALLMSNRWWSSRYEVACVVGGGGLTEAPEEGVRGSSMIHLIDSSNTKTKLMELERSLHCRIPSKGLIVLTGKMLSMGVSLPCTDVVILLNDGKSPDDMIQKMYRALTPSKGKTAAFVVDLNPVRSLAAVYGYTRASHEGTNSASEILDIITDVYSWDADMYEINVTTGKDTQAPRPLDFQARMKLLLEQAESDPVYRIAEDIGGFEKKMSDNIKRGMDSEFASKLAGQFSSKKLESTISRIGLKEGSKVSLQKGKLVIRIPKEPLADEEGVTGSTSGENIEIIIDNFIDTVADFVKYLAITSSAPTLEEALEEYQANASNDEGRSIQSNVLHLIRSTTQITEGKDKDLLSKLLIVAVKDFAFSSSKEVFRQMKGKIDDNTMRKDKVLSIIYDRLKPRYTRRKAAGEVFTPIALIEKMVGHLPKNIWKNPNMKWIDPANGIGNFPVVVFYKLDEGLSSLGNNKELGVNFSNEKQRRKFIIEEMLYMVELQSDNNRVAKRIFEKLCENCKPNILTLDSVDKDKKGNFSLINKITKKKFPEKYDIVMGNPPYQKGSYKSFYLNFIKLSKELLKDNGHLIFVIPNKILIPNDVNKAITQFDPEIIYHTVNADYFPSIATTICAVIAVNRPYQHKTRVIFTDGEMVLDLNKPTPTQYNSIKFKKTSDKIFFGVKDKERNHLKVSSTKPSTEHIYIHSIWQRFSPDKPKGGPHIFQIISPPAIRAEGKYIEIPDGISKSNLIWFLTRSEVIRFITKIYAGAMNVPAFIWNIIPFISLKTEDDSEVYELMDLDSSDIKTIRECLNDNIKEEENDEGVSEGGRRNPHRVTRRKARN